MQHAFKLKMSSKFLLLAMMMLAKVAPATSASKLYIDDFAIVPGQTRQVALNLDTDLPDVYMVSVRITLPDGLDFAKLDNGKWAAVNNERAAGSSVELNHSASSSYYGRVLVYNTLKTPISGNTGALVYFNVHAADTMTVDKLITLSEVSVRRTNGEVDEATCQGCTVSLLSKDDEGRDQLLAMVQSLEQKLNEVKSRIVSECADVKDMFTDRILLAEQHITALKTAINDGYENYALDREALAAQASQLAAEIDKLLADALAAQQAYEEGIELQEQEERMKFVNDSVYAVLSARLDALQAQLEAAKATIAADYKDVAAQFDERLAAIQQQINTLRANLQQKHEAIALTIDSQLDTSAVETSIAQILADAKNAQQAYEAEQEWQQRVAANEDAYARLNAQLDAAEMKLAAARDLIAEECKDVASQFDERLAALQQQIDVLRADLDLKHEAVALTADSQVDTNAIEAAITQLLADARQAQQAYEEQMRREAVNDSVFAAQSAQLDALQAQLDHARETITTDCKDVSSQFDERLTALQKQIDALRADLKQKHEEVALTADSKLDTSTIEAAIAKTIDDARQAQLAYEQEQEQIRREAVNDSVFAAQSAQLDALQAQLDATRAAIAIACKDVASQFDERLAALQQQIDALRADLQQKHEAVALTADDKLDTSALEAAIMQVLYDAEKAQQDYEEQERMRRAVNEAVFADLSARLDALQTEMDDAKTVIATDCQDVAQMFDERILSIQQQILDLRNALNQQYEAIALTADSELDTTAIEEAIRLLLDDAKAAQLAYDKEQERLEKERLLKALNDSIYAVLCDQLTTMQAKLDSVSNIIATECPLVAGQFTEPLGELQQFIDDYRSDLSAKYEALQLTANMSFDTAAFSQRLEQLLADARAAQSEETSIAGIKRVEGAVAYYDQHGHRVTGLLRGQVTIVKMSDGSTRKVFVK